MFYDQITQLDASQRPNGTCKHSRPGCIGDILVIIRNIQLFEKLTSMQSPGNGIWGQREVSDSVIVSIVWSRKANYKRKSMANHHVMLVRMVRNHPGRFSNPIGVPGMQQGPSCVPYVRIRGSDKKNTMKILTKKNVSIWRR